MKKTILSLFVLTTVLVSCKKSDSPSSCDFNATNLVGTYKLTALTYKANTASPTVDEFATYSACEKDDLTIFNANNTTTYTDAGVVCSPAGNGTGIWAITGANTLNVDGDNGTVTSFSCTGMTVTFAGTAAGELTTATLVKQ